MRGRSPRASPARDARGALLAIAILSLLPGARAEHLPARADNLLLLDAARAGPRVVAVGERGTVLLSEDEGRSWRRAASASSATLTAVYFLNDRLGWVVGHDATILSSTDGGLSWERRRYAPGEERPLLDVLFVDHRRGFAVGAYGAFLESRDAGLTWRSRSLLADDRHLNAIALAGKALLVAGESGTLLRSTDGGRSWAELPSPYPGSYFGILATPRGAALLFGLRGRLFRSVDQGGTWRPVDAGTEATLQGAAAGSGRILLLGSEGAVLSSRDDGRSFVREPEAGRSALASVLPVEGGWLLCGERGCRRGEGP